MEEFSSSAESYSQVDHDDLVSHFRRLVLTIANVLDDRASRSVRYLYKNKFSQGGDDMKALEILEKLEENGVFSAKNIQPLEDLLKHISRCDLIHTYLEPYRQRYLLSQTSGTGKLKLIL